MAGTTDALQLAQISELRIGSIVLRDVPIAFAQVPPFVAFDLTDRPALLLGADLMENFRRISLDFRAQGQLLAAQVRIGREDAEHGAVCVGGDLVVERRRGVHEVVSGEDFPLLPQAPIGTQLAAEPEKLECCFWQK